MNQLIRQTHRWLSIAFTISVVTYAVVMARGPVPAWLNIFPAGSLILMFVTGAYLFVLPHLPKGRVAKDPFATFSEWNSKVDREGYADL